MTQVKIIKNFEINTLDLEPTASTRRFRIFGDDGVAFIFGDAKEGRKFANYLKKQRSLGKVVKMRGDRLMVSMYY